MTVVDKTVPQHIGDGAETVNLTLSTAVLKDPSKRTYQIQRDQTL